MARDRSINFCKLRTFLRSPACDAVKIRCRRRRTSPSTSGPVDRPPVESVVLRSVHQRGHAARGVQLVLRFRRHRHRFLTGSPDPRQHPFGSGQLPVSGQLSETTGGGPAILPRFPVAFRPPAFASQVILSPLGDWAFLTVGLPATDVRRTPTGLPRSTRTRYDRGGCLLYPGAAVLNPADWKSSAGACRFTAASPAPRLAIHRRGSRITRHQRRFTQFTRPVFPLPVTPGWNGTLGLSPELRTPPLPATHVEGGARPSSTAWDYASGISRSSNLRVRSLRATSCRNFQSRSRQAAACAWPWARSRADRASR